MRAIFATSANDDSPLDAVSVGQRPEPESRDGWTTVAMRAASVNRHDVWTLRGVGIRPDEFPMILGCDGAGVTADGQEVVIHPVIGDPGRFGDETLDPGRKLLTEGGHQGTMAQYVTVPSRNVIPKPASMSFEQASVLGTSYLTAYRMIFTRAQLRPGSTMLVQGATGGVSTALIQLGKAAGMTVWATSRTEEGRARAMQLGAAASFDNGARLPERVDAVFDSVGEATWSHSMRAVRPGGTIVCCGATTGPNPSADLQRLFFLQIAVLGSTMGTLDELRRLIAFCESAQVTPIVDAIYPLAEGREAFEAFEAGSAGKIVISI